MAGPPEIEQRIDEIPDVQEIRNPSEAFRYLAFNLRKPPMSDLAFRRALAYVLDKEAIIDGVEGSTAFPIYSIIPPQLPFWYTDDIETWGRGMSQPERVEAAVRVLTDAGYTWTTPPQAVTDEDGEHTGEIIPGEGLTQPDGTPMPTIELLTLIHPQDMLRPVQGEWIARFAAPLGITIEPQPTEDETMIALVTPPTADGTGWDMYTLGWGGGDPSLPCSSHRAFFAADQDAAIGAGIHTPGYDDPDFEALSDAFDAATTEADAQPICAEMERNIAHNLPYIVLWTIPVSEIWRSYTELPVTQILGGTRMAPGLIAAVRLND